ncbi:HK97 family phage prohead protease [Microbacterium sp. No. 7]|uniref:HK97 family phage prohead protease n=1 Tax=Microbacterium sp. No. 7 TaxID=1714373 RepID=UPI0006D213AD|nr:HK97 family phage prohead protease [Microbacterium sp. No. 7]ALJ20385.1 primosome assembly protein PriA [Microbacterium sp. No. 7]
MKIKSLPVAFKAGPDDGLAEGEFIVYPSTFTRTPDAYGDVVAKGAFAEGIAHRRDAGIHLPGLFGHRMDDPDYFVAAAIEEDEDDHGWRVKGAFDMDAPKGAQTYRLVKSGRVRELSFAYDTLEEAQVTLDDGTKANELRKLDVFEFSFVPIGANRDTSVVAVKSATVALLDGLKAGRVLAQKHIDSLRSAQEAIGAVIAAAEADTDQEKAGGSAGAKDEGAAGVKSEGVAVSPSRRLLAINQFIQSL